MKMSARNMLNGKVEGVTVGKVMASVKIRIEDPNMITAIITQESVNELDIKEGDVVKAIIKSTEVMIGKNNFLIFLFSNILIIINRFPLF